MSRICGCWRVGSLGVGPIPEAWEKSGFSGGQCRLTGLGEEMEDVIPLSVIKSGRRTAGQSKWRVNRQLLLRCQPGVPDLVTSGGAGALQACLPLLPGLLASYCGFPCFTGEAEALQSCISTAGRDKKTGSLACRQG